jgi:hypothetical protein
MAKLASYAQRKKACRIIRGSATGHEARLKCYVRALTQE